MVWSGSKAPEQETEPAKALAAWVEDEFERFSNEQLENLQAVDLRPVFNSPTRPREGMIIYSDATKFDPGAGAGWYGRSAAGLWIPLAQGLGAREILFAARTYYVRSDGLDTNNGRTNTAGGAFLTIQKAVDAVAALDVNAYPVTIQIADGTYTGAVVLKNVVGFAKAGDLVIQGNSGTPANVLISVAGSAFVADGISTIWDIKDLKIAVSTIGSSSIVASNGAYVRFGNLDFGAASSYQLIANGVAAILCLSSYKISGGCTSHAYSVNCSAININVVTVTLTGTPGFSQFVTAADSAALSAYSVTFSGPATGQRYWTFNNGVIFTNGGGPTYFPGNAAGVGTNSGVSPYGLYA